VHGQPYAIAAIRDMTALVNNERKLRDSEKRFRDTFNQAAIGLAHVGLTGKILRVNEKMMDMLGYAEEQLLAMNFRDITHPEDLPEHISKFKSLLRNEEDTFFIDKRYQTSTGNYVWVRLTASLVRSDKDSPQYFIVAFEDISSQIFAKKLLEDSERKFRSIVESFEEDVVFWMTTPGMGKVLYVSKGYENIWGRSCQSLIDNPQSFVDLVHPDDKSRVLHHFREHKRGIWDINYRIVREDGQIRYISDLGYGVMDDNNKLIYLIGRALDRTVEVQRQHQLDDSLRKLKIAYQELAESAKIDDLTETYNRKALYEELVVEFNRFERYHRIASIIFIDIDDFKTINDVFGHLAGDKVLVELSRMLHSHVRDTDTIGRYGGDEFVILLRDTPYREALEFAERIQKMQLLVSINNENDLKLSLSIGVNSLNNQIDSVDEWIKHADTQMYQAKGKHKRQRSESVDSKLISS
jgi:diguanylate cyclase (GGDEF)-like protein/PAS domain S-box-containing protein